MITANELIAQCEIPLEEKWGYIWGKSGQVWTQADQDAATDDTIKRYGQQWVGRRVCDCSGLPYWAFSELGGWVHHGSNSIWNYDCVNSTKGTLKNGKRTDGKEIRPGSAVFLTETKDGGKLSRHHIGVYIGANTCIEAKGTKSGVVASALSHWDEVAEFKGVSYGGEKVFTVMRNGSRGEEVKELQEQLIRMGYDCGTADGIFGRRTEEAVKEFQKEHDLDADGIVGEQTQKALGWGTEEDPDPEEPVETDPVDEAEKLIRQALALLEKRARG